MANPEKKRGSALKFMIIIFFLVLIILGLSALILYMKYGDEIYGNLARWGIVPNRPATEQVAGAGDGADGESGESPENGGNEEEGSSSAQTGDGTEETLSGEIAGENGAGDTGESSGENAADAHTGAEASGETAGQNGAAGQGSGSEPAIQMSFAEADALPYGLSLSKTDITIRALGTINTLFAGGGTGEYTWISKNPDIASVDQEGHITSVSSGRTTVLVTDGEMKGTCIVRISAGRVSSDAKLNATDVTVRLSNPQFRVQVEGASSEVGFLTNNAAVATVTADGMVTVHQPGTAIITAYWGNEYLLCTIRVPREEA